jgi:hypothetical protein
MTEIYVVEDPNGTDTGMTVIQQLDGDVVTHSWASDEIPVEARLNPDAPPAQDTRDGYGGAVYSWRMPDAACWARMDGDADGRAEERRQAFRQAMVEAGRDVSTEVGLIRR